ncbi:MAG: hypothetical protein GC179_00670 [Anaerolineaceae bacterium]|nr:hypothetical protein [Anaerolineaceae bacterium]
MRHSNKIVLKICFLLLFLFSLSAVTSAQGTTDNTPTLTYSVASTGEISDSAFSQTWTLTTASADRISVHVERTEGNLLPTVSILDATDKAISQSNIDQTGAAADIENFKLPSAGTYKVFVQRVNADKGSSTGKYSILISPLATAEDNPNNTVVLGDVEYNKAINGEITSTQWYQRYSFNANGQDVVRISAKRTSGTLYPEIEVLDANGASLNKGYTDDTGGSATLEKVRLPNAGQYTIVVTRANRFNGATTGTYQLDVTLVGAGEDNPMLAAAPGTVTYDTELKGSINALWYQDWTLKTDSADLITISVTRSSGDLIPQILLLGGSGQEVSRANPSPTGDSATLRRYQLRTAGTFTIRIWRIQGKNGVTSGDYSLKVELVGSGEGSSNLADKGSTIESGQPQTGTLTGVRWLETYTYKGTQGDKIDIVVNRTEGTLIPRIEIQDSNGQRLRSSALGDNRDSASIVSYTLPGNADYKIVVTRDGGQTGYTTGGYSVSVSPAAK